MGRNADKRKQRRAARAEQVAEEHAVDRANAAAERMVSVASPQRLTRSVFASLELDTTVTDSALYIGLSSALFQLSAAIAVHALEGKSTSDLTDVAKRIAAMMEADTVSLALFVDEALGDGARRSSLRLVSSHRRLSSDERLLTFHADDELAGEVLRTARPLRIDDAPRDPRFARAYGQRSDIGSLLLVPLSFDGRLLGVLAASRKEVRGFYDDDEHMLAVIASQLAQDLEQSRLLHQAFTDPATGLVGRQGLLFWLPKEIERSRRYGSPFSIGILEVEARAALLERFGANVATAALCEFGRRLQIDSRQADLVARYSDELFVIAAPVVETKMRQALQRLLDDFSAVPVVLGDVEIPLIPRVVCTELREDDDLFSLLLRAEHELRGSPGG